MNLLYLKARDLCPRPREARRRPSTPWVSVNLSSSLPTTKSGHLTLIYTNRGHKMLLEVSLIKEASHLNFPESNRSQV